MIDLPETPAGVVITMGLAALLAAATGAKVSIAGNEIGATTRHSRALTGLLGAVLVAWSAWSLQEEPFRIVGTGRAEVRIVDVSSRSQCQRAVEVSSLVRFEDGPGTIRYEIGLEGLPSSLEGAPQAVRSHKVTQKGSGTDLLGPERIPIGSGRPPRNGARDTYLLWGSVVLVAPTYRAIPIHTRPQSIPPCSRAKRD